MKKTLILKNPVRKKMILKKKKATLKKKPPSKLKTNSRYA